MSTVKSAVSLPKELFDEVEEEARERKVPRSHIYVMALQEHFQRKRKERLLQQINAATAEGLDEEDKAFLEDAWRLYSETLEPEEW